ncbi:conserved oligomeric Golgi complex subunit 5 isoform X2 [Cimex lectularius]|uniref:Conserved oligomeric Golgi complex subunit 5 n=1 Tax=Cimex lectularius TaxID=79782 RepID=A0A8I6TM25_CIMLE|nr:conserved oligomeric Golgi complex subunit 5 isoform X2 [Cimex lectularius]
MITVNCMTLRTSHLSLLLKLGIRPVNISSYIDFLCQFINKLEHPEVDLQNYVHHTLSVTEQLSRLSDGISLLDKELQRQVLEKHEDLVSQATWVEKLQGVLSVMHIHVQSLVSSVDRMKMKIIEPHQRLEMQSVVLSRLHETTDLLRRASRVQHLAKKLPDLDPARAAHIISELEEQHRDVDLTGLDILEPEGKQIKHVKAVVEQQASKIMEQGLTTLNSEKVTMGIDILDKLGLVEIEVQKIMDKWLNNIDAHVGNVLNMENLFPASRSGAGRVTGINIPANIQNFRSELWSSWGNTLNKPVFTTCAQMAIIQTVLSNRITFCDGKPSGKHDNFEVTGTFWVQVDDILSKHLNQAAKNSSYIKQALEGEYPKLLRLHLDFHKKLKSLNFAPTNKSMYPQIGKCVKQFETAYLSRSINVLIGAVQEMFPHNETTPLPPSIDKVDSLIKIISRELDVSLVDDTLTGPVAKNIAKAISLFCQKGEQMLDNTQAATQVIELLTPGQELNVGIANILFYFCEQMKTVVSKSELSKNLLSLINEAILGGEKLTQQILNPLLSSILVAIESILITMHKEDYDLKEYTGSPSLYMRELQAFIPRAVSTYLSPFHNQIQISQSCMEVASRTIELFMRNICLVRPVNENGRKKLIADFKCLEMALSPLCIQLSELGGIYSTLRSLRPLITSNPEEVAKCPVLGQVVPYSLAVTLLFSMGPQDLPLPHQSVGWSISKFSQWLDNHNNEKDRLEFLKGALWSYQKANKQAKTTQLYQIIKDLIDRGNVYLLTEPSEF